MQDSLICIYTRNRRVAGAKGSWGLVRRRQWWLTNGRWWTKAWRGSIWHWLPSDRQTPFISTAIVKLMSYVCNRLRWLEKPPITPTHPPGVWGGLIRIGGDSWKEVNSFRRWWVKKGGPLVLWCGTEAYTNINDGEHGSVGTESWNAVPDWDLKCSLFRCLVGEEIIHVKHTEVGLRKQNLISDNSNNTFNISVIAVRICECIQQ